MEAKYRIQHEPHATLAYTVDMLDEDGDWGYLAGRKTMEEARSAIVGHIKKHPVIYFDEEGKATTAQ